MDLSVEVEADLYPDPWPHLPAELRESILTQPGLTWQDLVHLSQTCRSQRQWMFHPARQTGLLWQIHAGRAYPLLLNTSSPSSGEPINWLARLQIRHRCQIRTLNTLQSFSGRFFHRLDLSNDEIDEALQSLEDDFDIHDLVDAFETFLTRPDQRSHLTSHYYAQKVVQRIKHRLDTPYWQAFPDQLENQEVCHEAQIYLQAAVRLCQWFRTETRITFTPIQNKVDGIRSRVIEVLELTQPDHPVLERYRQHQTQTHPYALSDLKRLILVVNQVLFEEEQFQGNDQAYYQPENSFLHELLERKLGIPISLCLLYMIVVLDLGVDVAPLNFPRHFLIRIQPSEGAEATLYLDAFAKGRLLGISDLRRMTTFPLQSDMLSPVGPLDLFRRMTRNLTAFYTGASENSGSLESYSDLRSCFELMILLGGENEIPEFALIKTYLQLNINHRQIRQELDRYQRIMERNGPGPMGAVIQTMKRIVQEEAITTDATKVEVKTRSLLRDASDQFGYGRLCVGLICQHKMYDYKCVVYGWDPTCVASRSWILQMGVNKLPHGADQPFCNVLVEDGSIRYAAEDNLEPVPSDSMIAHPLAGKYFSSHNGRVYIPNQELQKVYPEDLDVLNAFLFSPLPYVKQ
ncbi:F-box only protein 21-like isoform X2 [Tigriopus californicus]|uniref:F-box only protein 21-like isoform X2 n=1 Tax=Tigriopus californicus TaxID=6832 RepID=UPI0027DAA379|nr:F-box only protein 21-like isoform X2 [Tigriopus californicus]